MKNQTYLILNILRIFFWIANIVITICIIVLILILLAVLFNINLGDIQSSFKLTILGQGITIKELQDLGKIYSVFILGFCIIIATLELKLFSTVIKILKNLESKHVFSQATASLISKTSKLLALIAFLSLAISFFTELLKGKFTILFDLDSKNLQFLIFAAIVFVISQVYQQAVDLKKENDLTI